MVNYDIDLQYYPNKLNGVQDILSKNDSHISYLAYRVAKEYDEFGFGSNNTRDFES